MGGISGSVRIRQGRACCGVLKNFRRFDYYGLCGQCFFFLLHETQKCSGKQFLASFQVFSRALFSHLLFTTFIYYFFHSHFFLTGTFFVFFHGYYHTVFRTGCIFHGHKFDFFRHHLPKKSTGTDIFDKTGTGDFYYTREQTREHFCSRDS